MKTQSIQSELIRLIVVPVLAVCLVLSATFYYLQSKHINSQLAATKYLAQQLLSNTPLDASSPSTMLTAAASGLLSTGQYHSVLLIDDAGNTVASYGLPILKSAYANHIGFEHEWTHESFALFTFPLTMSHLDKQPVPPKNYWVIIASDKKGWSIAAYQGTIMIILAASACLFLTFYFARRFREALASPLSRIENGVKDFLKGNYEKSIPVEPNSVFKELSININKLGAIQKSASDELQINIDQSTHDLRETLETVEIQNIELDLARKTALQASRVKSEFLANTSHEIRTPLNGILGFSELLRKTDLNHQQIDYLGTIEESAKGLLTIINDILDFSRLEIGTLTLEYKPVKVRQLIEDTLKLQTPSANEKNIRLLTIIDHDVPENLLGDPLRLKQVLSNLISNAIKFTETGYILIGVSKDQSSDNQFTLKFRVTDSGIGLSQEQQEKLFDPFTQIDSSESRLHGGTGLGLAIAKGLVDRMNGTIGVESTLGKGATFWFTSTLGKSPSSSAKQGYLAGSLRNVHALVYDHSNMGRMEITHYLTGWGVKVCEAALFDELEPQINFFAKSEPIDIAIIDSMIDNKIFDRNRLCDQVRQLNAKFSIPIVVLAPSSIQRIIEPHLTEENCVFINRPLFCNKLHTVICDMLEIVASENIESRNTLDLQQDGEDQQQVNILAVDDNPANLKLVSELLKGLNIDVRPVDSGEKALNALEEETFDLILMDIQMPSMDGIEATKRIREIEKEGVRTPIIALTAHAVSEQKSRLLLAGMDDCLSKPVSENELRHVIERWTNVTISTKIPPVTEPKPLTAEPTQSTTPSGAEPSHNQEAEQTGDKRDSKEPALITPTLQPTVDLQLSLNLTNNNAGLAADMLSMLIETLPDVSKKATALYEDKQFTELQEVIHKLHGGCCYCGVPKLKAISERIDKNLQKQSLNSLANDMHLLKSEINALLEWAEAHDVEAIFATD